jgi:molybdopterin synthase sulfur carrier subunit
MAVKVNVRLYAVARDWMGIPSLELAVSEGTTTEAVWEELERRQPRFREWREQFRLAVNDEYIDKPVLLHSGDTVAVIPPVSGG